MTTPTPGDLSARLEADFHKAIAPHASKRSQGYIMGAFRAALSALPAAGGGDAVTVSREILENADTGLAISNYKGDLWSEYESPRWELRTALGLPCKSNHTTPQPSAAVHEGVGCVFCDLNTDHRAPCTAVGAQGDGWASGVNACIAWVEKRRHDFEAEYGRVDPTTGAMEFGNTAREEYDCELAEIEEGLRSLLVAAPAAGKGVDEVAFWRETYRQHMEAEASRAGHPTTAAKCFAHNAILEVEGRIANAALTRQPVAGENDNG